MKGAPVISVVMSVYNGEKFLEEAIESVWSYAKIRLVKFKGMDKKMFNLHLKECEFRFNNRKQNFVNILLAIIRKESLKLS
jgi:transposase-like protein